ncbi:DUF5695 domain-containing protein [Arcticibacter sp. MXS-1]|uniref:DUF5695 domain-containing protein n=1 Tax=Arcticibacter sp. MXS-1 TaxID=3341726 RepID=UPI0035A98AFB
MMLIFDTSKLPFRIATVMVILLFAGTLRAQSPWDKIAKMPSSLDLAQGYIDVSTPSFSLKLVRSSQTVAALSTKDEPSFDFTPGEWLQQRSKDGMYHLGDINLRLRTAGETDWKDFSTAEKRMPVKALEPGGGVLVAADLSQSFSSPIPLQVARYWENVNGELVLRFEILNKGKEAVEIGALGLPLIFNNMLEGKTLEVAHARNVFFDPYIGLDAGYLQVAKLSGEGKVLLVLPYKNTGFEAYNPLLKDPTPKGITFEGFHEWMVCSKAYAEKEWKSARQWNEPTSLFLKPGESRSLGLRFVLANSIRTIEKTLASKGRPVAAGVPGYVIPEGTDASLFLGYPRPVRSFEVEPKGALILEPRQAENKAWKAYSVKGKIRGRARLTITYQDGLRQTIHYKVIKAEEEVIADFGRFLTREQWFEDPQDPFRRSPSVISYDYERKEQVKQDSRAWIPGLSDEGGAGSWLGAVMKQLILPDKDEVMKLERFVNETLWGGIQYKEGENKFGVRKSLFYYEPDKMPPETYSNDINFKTWSAWNIKAAESPGRSYNYPHVAAAHWVLYRLARNYQGLVSKNRWDWYLENAFQTSLAMVRLAPHYAQFGQMEGSVFLLILQDLKAEGLNAKALELEAAMKKRADLWNSLQYPFGSEMPWDSTGQEEVYMWSDYFGYTAKADVTLHAILAYMPTLPHWGYNGSARRYWDFLYGGKLQRIERQLHHYGSGLNAIPVLKEYRKNPEDLYLLRVGQGGLLGAISNITEDGFGPAAFHSYPSTLEIDGLSGDYGCNFYGYAVNSGAYLVHDPQFGWLGFGANVRRQGQWVHADLTTAGKSRVFIAPLQLWLTLDAGRIRTIAFNPASGKLRMLLEEGSESTPTAFLRFETIGQAARLDEKLKVYAKERGAYKIPLQKKAVWVDLQ